MALQSINPANAELIEAFDELSDNAIDNKLNLSLQTYSNWRNYPYSKRAELFMRLAVLLKSETDNYAKIISMEMGKPLAQAIAEVEKCAWVCEYYAQNAEAMLANRKIDATAYKTYVRHDPIGPVMAIMPWNFPFWQVFRFAAPNLMAGNVSILKHASNVPQCGIAIEKLFMDAGFNDGAFINLLIGSSKAEQVIKDERIKAVTLTGSEQAGKAVASAAGSALKKCVLELGGSDPFIVLEDADLEKAAKIAAQARLVNSGQTCIASKRFIVTKNIANEFAELFMKNLATFKVGDPMEPDTSVGPMARIEFCKDLDLQIEGSLKQGAEVLYKSEIPEGKGYYYPVTLLSNVTPQMPVGCEETFGPVAALLVAVNEQDAIKIANNTKFGLASSIWSNDLEKAESIAAKIDAGCVFINDLPKSDPRIPFGGTKMSGFGRELSIEGIKEFVNIKSVLVEKT